MENDAQKVKEALDIIDVVGSYLALKRAGASFKGKCPFHDERTPSFMVNPERQIYKCFGCDEGGDVIDFVMKMESLTFPEALKLLAERAGVTLTPFRPTAGGRFRSDEPDVKSRLYRANALAAQLFYKILTTHSLGKDARAYLKERGLNEATIRLFHIGYAPLRNPAIPALQKYGLSEVDLSAAGGPQKFRDRIIFPIFDPLGNTVGFTGRLLRDLPDSPKYINTPETPIFHKQHLLYGLAQAKNAIRKSEYAVLVEGQMDVVLSHQIGVNQVVASSGTAITESHLKRLSRLANQLILSFDADGAGQKATLAALTLALPLGFTVKVVAYPTKIKDAGEAIKKDPAIWKTAVAHARYWPDWIIATQGGEMTSVESKKKLAKIILPLLALISDPIEQGHWIVQLALKLGVKEDEIRRGIQKLASQPSARISQKDEVISRPPDKTALTLVDQLYGLLLLFPQLQTQNQALYISLQRVYAGKVNALKNQLSARCLDLSLDGARAEVAVLRGRLRSQKNEQLKSDFASQIAQAESSGNRNAVKKLMTELQEKIKPKSPNP